MAEIPLSRHFFRYKKYPSTEWSKPVQCTYENTIENVDGSFTVKNLPNINIEVGGFEIFYYTLAGEEVIHSTNPANFYLSYGLPRINLTVGSTITFTKQNATMQILNGYGSNFPAVNLYNADITIKLRGHSTAGAPKKPYSIDLVTPLGADNNKPLLGMKSYNGWALLADGVVDLSLVKSRYAFELGKMIMRTVWTPSTRSCEVYLNSVYIGIYSITENVKRNDNRVKLTKMEVTDITLPNLSGGYLLEQCIDEQEDLEADTYFTTPVTREPYLNSRWSDNLHSQRIEYPKFGTIVPAQTAYITNYVRDFEYALYNEDFDDLENGYRNYLDIPSAVDYYIAQEILYSFDGPSHSLFYSKNRNEKIKMGPLWDYDASLGTFISGVTDMNMASNYWYRKLLTDPYFLAEVKDRYAIARQYALDILDKMNNVAEGLILTGAMEDNFVQWPDVAIPAPYVDAYRAEVLKNDTFVRARIDFLDLYYLNAE